MRNSLFETVLGGVVVIVAGVFLMFALGNTGSGASGDRYKVSASFESVTGIQRGSDVRVAGVKVGSVSDVSYDGETGKAVLSLSVEDNVVLTNLASARIASDGLLGGAFVDVSPGDGEERLAADGTGAIAKTQSATDLMEELSKLGSAFGVGPSESVGSDLYSLQARFDSVSGIREGSDVRMAGVTIGQVNSVSYDNTRNKAVLRLSVRRDIELTDAANARIANDGLLGGAFVALNPGGGFDLLPMDGSGVITDTQGALDLLAVMSQLGTQQGENN